MYKLPPKSMSIILEISVILDYEYRENEYCGGRNLGKYSTLALAKSACSDNDQCGSITDVGCDGDEWNICGGSSLSLSSKGACSWLKNSNFFVFRYLNI